ncbi:hypothetical protein ACLBNB_22775 [Pseudomonas chlororaphis subsp. aurantiaca]|uniref:hypothetical protein n=1 Tax=Pseudomonas chlororaphis TaxID=587753 RepID=UPI000F562D1B|nr:hypothetical protein [Pseudomonas chlororaphis]AZD56207.1 hypothetical protein C4K19_4434 [Pseudomonas chlororaphis subsp. aurantiaca]
MINFILVFFTNVLFSAPSIFLVVVCSHLGSFDEVALLGVSFAICAPVQLFFSMQHNVSILSGQLILKDSLRTRVLLIIPFLLFGFFGALFFSSQIVFWFFLYRCAEFLYEPLLCEGIRQGSYRKVFVSTLFRFVLFSSIVFFLLYLGNSLSMVLLVLGVVFSLLAFKSISLAFDGGESTFEGFFLGAAAFFSSLIVNVPRYFVSSADPSFAAFYSSMLTLVLGGGLLYGAFNNYFFPKFCASGKSGALRFLNVSIGVFLAGLLSSYLLFSGAFISNLFLGVFLGDKYLLYSELVVGFVLFYFVLYFHAALNFLFVYLGLARVYMTSLIVYGLCMTVFIFVRMKLFSDDFSQLIWIVFGFGVFYGAVCYIFLMIKFLKGYKE